MGTTGEPRHGRVRYPSMVDLRNPYESLAIAHTAPAELG
jgi:hypothetical protein